MQTSQTVTSIRHIVLAGLSQPPWANTYNCRFWNFYINRFLFPQLFEEEDLNTFLGVTHAELYRLVQQFARPLLAAGGPGTTTTKKNSYFIFKPKFSAGGTLKPHRMTADALMAALLVRVKHNNSLRLTGLMFRQDHQRVQDWVTRLRDQIYLTDPWLVRGRNLGNPG